MIGTTVGAVAGYFGGGTDNLLMRFTDLILTLPGLAILLVASIYLGQGDPFRVGAHPRRNLLDGDRADRPRHVPLAPREGVRRGGEGLGGRRRADHHPTHASRTPSAPIIVSATLIFAAAILTEAALSFLGFGIQPPNPALGQLINDGQSEGLKFWWMVTFPGLVIVFIALCINFIGDGLRDALDPTQRRLRD